MLYIFVCLLTFFVANHADLMYENITGVSSMPQYHFMVVAYTLFTTLFFVYKIKKVYHHFNDSKPLIHTIIFISAIMMIVGSFFQYTINAKDISSQIHVYFSMIPSLSFLTLLFFFNRKLFHEYPTIYLRIHWYYDLGLQFLGLLFIVFTRVNGYIEILFAILVSSYLYILENQFNKDMEEKSSSL